VCGIGIGLLGGHSIATCPAAVTPTGGTDGATDHYLVDADAPAPITLCGIGIALLGDATASGACPPGTFPLCGLHLALGGDAKATCPPAAAGAGASAAPGRAGPDDVVRADLTAPITVCGLALALKQDATGQCPAAVPSSPVVLDAKGLHLGFDGPITLCGLAAPSILDPPAPPCPKRGSSSGSSGSSSAPASSPATAEAMSGLVTLPGLTRLVRWVRRGAARPPTDAAVDPAEALGAVNTADAVAMARPAPPTPAEHDGLLMPVGTGALVLGGGLLSTVYRARLRELSP
jgi:hypothetical protein